MYPIDGIDMLVHNKNLKHKVQRTYLQVQRKEQ